VLFKQNGIVLNLPFTFSKRRKYPDRSPKPEELQKVIETANIREKAIVSILALSGMRIGTLAKLEYRHIMKDYEKGVLPIHLHIESDIVKGKYADYDTFLSQEAVQYIETYLESRKIGTRKIPPEIIKPDSPLIRDLRSKEPKPITESQIHRVINKLYKKTGVISKEKKVRYRVRPHSIRKYFKTQMTALGIINSDYIEYMMGHVTDTYNDVQGLGMEHLRQIYASSGLSIRPKTEVSKLELLRGVVISLGLDPDKILSSEALVKPYRTVVDPKGNRITEMQILSKAIKKSIVEEIKTSRNSGMEQSSPEKIRTPV
jgi:integrase